jgi:hypothetical protein
LLLVTILLVLVAAVTLLIGIFSDNLALIFISIGASALAAIVLAVLSQMSRRKARVTAPATAPEPLPARQPAPSSPAPSTPTATTGRQAAAAASSIADVGEPVVATTSVAVDDLPIAGYDTMRVNDILPALDDLDLDQLETVAQYEESNKNRTTVLNRIDDLMDELEAAEAGGGAAPSGDVAAAAVETIEDIGEPVVAVADAASDGFPIPNYDALDEDEVIALLDDLDADQLETVADREEAGPNRDAVLDAIDDRLDILEGIVPAPPAKKAAAPPAKKVAAKKAVAVPSKKAAAKKAVAASAPAKKAATGAARKAAAAPAKATGSAKKAAAGSAKKSSAPAKKAATAPAKKATSTAKSAKATKKTVTPKKAAPVKKASTAKKATKTAKR